MGAWTRPISTEVDMQAQLVAMPRGEEWGNVYKRFCMQLIKAYEAMP